MSAMWIAGAENNSSGNVFLFRREITLEEFPGVAELSITAATWYRLKVNGVWICDGPGHFVPEHTSFDRVELSSVFHRGGNLIEITSPGEVWCSLTATLPDGCSTEIGSDRLWQTLPLPLRVADGCEWMDFSISGRPAPLPAAEVCDGEAGIWQDFRERSCRMMTRREFLLCRFVSAFQLDRASGEETFAAEDDVQDPSALLHPDFDCTGIQPTEGCDMRLCYDLGEENVGYWSIVLAAPAGTVVELCSDGGEKITLICREGWNRWTSMIRCRGRYLSVILKEMRGSVRIQSLRLAESAYPLDDARFACSDYQLAKAFEVSRRTLKLCMEDTFCDASPWGENCRNELLFALSCGGAYDLVRRTLQFGGCVNPSPTWVCALEDYIHETGDHAFLREIWQNVRRVMDAAIAGISPENGLAGERLEDNFCLAGALLSADRLSQIVGDMEVAYGQEFRKLAEALKKQWDSRNLAWPETCGTATGFPAALNALAVLFEVIPEDFAAAVRANVLSPRMELDSASSPAGIFNICLALEKLDAADRILPMLMEQTAPMLDAGETAYPCACRGNAHAGEAALLYFIPRRVLGLIPHPGGKKFTVSPLISDLEWASGSRMTPAGAIHVSWRKNGKNLDISLVLPKGIEAEFQPNIFTQGYEVTVTKLC